MITKHLQSLVGCHWSLFHISLMPLQTWQLPRRSTPPSHLCKAPGPPLGPVRSAHWTNRNYGGAMCPSHGTVINARRKKTLQNHQLNPSEVLQGSTVCVPLTSVISREAAAALMCKLGCLTELLQSSARAKVPTALKITHSQSIHDTYMHSLLHGLTY